MSLDAFNALDEAAAREALTRCCGAGRWVDGMLERRPFASTAALFAAAEAAWAACGREDVLEAFAHHPRIGDRASLEAKFASTARWAANEQAGTATAAPDVLDALAELNARYAEKFGFIFIVCATGKSAAEMLALLEARLPNEAEVELAIAAGEQAKITRLRLEKLLS